jgi:hypothetical protein
MKILIDKSWESNDADEITDMCFLLENINMDIELKGNDRSDYIKINGIFFGNPNVILYLHPPRVITENALGESLIFGAQIFNKNDDESEKFIYKYGIHVLLQNNERSYYIYHPSM